MDPAIAEVVGYGQGADGDRSDPVASWPQVAEPMADGAPWNEGLRRSRLRLQRRAPAPPE